MVVQRLISGEAMHKDVPAQVLVQNDGVACSGKTSQPILRVYGAGTSGSNNC